MLSGARSRYCARSLEACEAEPPKRSAGLLFDDAGHRIVPTHATKAGVRYRYYVSLPHQHGESKTASVGSISRVPATDIENIIVKSLNEHLIAQKEKPASSQTHVRDGKAAGL